MTYKEFGEEAEIQVIVKIIVNDTVVYKNVSFDIDGGIEALGKAERHNFIANEIEKQWQELPENYEDESPEWLQELVK